MIVLSMFMGEVQNKHLFDHLDKAAIRTKVEGILERSKVYNK